MPVGLLALAAAGVVAWRVAREARRLYVIVLVMLATVVLSVMRTAGAVQDYRLFYTWVPPMLAAVVVAWVVWIALARYPAARRALSGAALAGAVVVAVVLAVSGATQGTPHADDAKVVADKLLADREAGVLSEDAYRFYLDVIGTEKAGDQPATAANDVAVFIDGRSAAERER